MDIVEFLRARVAEDESMARGAAGHIHDDGLRWVPGPANADGVRRADGIPVTGHSWPQEMAHICRWDPRRVLAEVKTKRETLNEYESDRENYFAKEAEVNEWDDSTEGYIDLVSLEHNCGALLFVLKGWASMFADHPDYASIRQLQDA